MYIMDFPLPVQSVSTVDYFKPLHVDTNIVYDIDEDKFPGLNDSFHRYEPSLVIMPNCLFDQTCSPDITELLQEDAGDHLESLDVSFEFLNVLSDDIADMLLNDIDDVIQEDNRNEIRLSRGDDGITAENNLLSSGFFTQNPKRTISEVSNEETNEILVRRSVKRRKTYVNDFTFMDRTSCVSTNTDISWPYLDHADTLQGTFSSTRFSFQPYSHYSPLRADSLRGW